MARGTRAICCWHLSAGLSAPDAAEPVADIFKWHGVTPWCVTATAGIEQTIDTAARTANSTSNPIGFEPFTIAQPLSGKTCACQTNTR
jgi:hypothetical protein